MGRLRLLFPVSLPYRCLPGLQVLVQVFIVPEKRLIDRFDGGRELLHLGCRSAARFVIVEEGMYSPMPFEKRQGFRQIDNRVQHRRVDAQGFGYLQRELGKKVHKSLECDHGIGAVVDGGDVFGATAAFEPFGAQLPPSGIISEPDGEKGFAANGITHLPAVGRCDGWVNTPTLEVADECRVMERRIE